MNKLLKLSSALGVAGVSMALFTATAAFADSTNVTNTGNDVVVSGGSSDSTHVTVNNSNSAVVSQSSTSNLNTGGNTANQNIGSTGIQTGSAVANNAFGVKANSNVTNISGVGSSSGDSASLTNTGDNVFFGAGGGNNTNVTVNNSNSAYVTQHAVTNSNTGYNTANQNIADNGGVMIQTGNAGANNVFATQVNGNMTTIGGIGAGNSGNSLDVVNTGNNVGLWGDNGDSTYVHVNNSNQAYIDQSAYSDLNTGHNKSKQNIAGIDGWGDNSIMTGDAVAWNQFSATANSNMTAVNLSGWGGSGDDTSIINTGDCLQVYGSGSNTSTHVGVNNYNSAYINQRAHTDANTGYNKDNQNIGFGGSNGLSTGAAGALTALMAQANYNFTGIGSMNQPSMWSWWM